MLLLFWSLEETFAMDEVTEDEVVKVEENEIKVEILEEHDEARMCDVCSAVCKSVRALQKHKKVKHDTRQYICPECGISVEGMDKLRYHRKSHRTFKCTSCDKELCVRMKSHHMKICLKEDLSCDQLFSFLVVVISIPFVMLLFLNS